MNGIKIINKKIASDLPILLNIKLLVNANCLLNLIFGSIISVVSSKSFFFSKTTGSFIVSSRIVPSSIAIILSPYSSADSLS